MIGAKEKSKKAFNSQAATYDSDIKGQHARNLYPSVIKQISGKSYSVVLDLGCGTGELLRTVKEKEPGIKAYGIDISENMLQIAKGKLKDMAELVLGDSEHLPFENSFFDAVYCNDSFHHYPSPEKVITEVSRVLKPGGVFIICDCWQPLLSRSIMNFYMKHSSDGDVKMYSEKEIKSILASCFNEITWNKVNQTSYMASGKNNK